MENLVTASVVIQLFQLLVMRPVDFDNQPSAQTDEVGIVAQQGRVSSKVETFGSQGAQSHPQANRLSAHRLPQRPCSANAHGVIPHPTRFAGHPPRKGRDRQELGAETAVRAILKNDHF